MNPFHGGFHYYLPAVLPTTPDPGHDPEPWGETRVVGKPVSRVDGYERVSGTAVYPSDLSLPDMLYGAILRSPYPHARVRSLDVSKAAKMPGVRAVITPKTPGADFPWYRDGDGEGVGCLLETHCRFEGETVAAVAAETPYEAKDAVHAIAVDWEVLPHTVDYESALDPGAPEVRDGGNQAGEPQLYERGDVAAGFAVADVVVEESYGTHCILHTPLEPHGCVVRWEGRKRLVVWESTQGVYRVQSRLAEVFDLPLSNVRAIGHYVGGGFGSKLDPGKYSPIAALLARETARPVKLFLSREETFLNVGNRPAKRMRLKAGFKKDGTLLALEFEGLGSGGAYTSAGTPILDWQIKDLYRCENVKTKLTNVYIHGGDFRPMRAPGHPDCSWALEQTFDAAAEKLGMDPVELRLKNLTDVSQARGGVPYTSTGLGDCLKEGALSFGWQEARKKGKEDGHLVRGVGMASCVWILGSGSPPSTAVVKYFADGSANLNMGASDIGTGTKTVMAMVVAEELGVPLERIAIEHADTGTTQYATASGGSKTVPTESPAVRDAALACKRQLLDLAAAQLETPAADLTLGDGAVVSKSDPEKKVAVGDIKGLAARGLLVGVGYRGPNPTDKVACPFAAQFCEVEVNTLTGEVRIVRFLGAHDSGRVMNRKTFDNQVYGGIAMGIGFGTTERRVLDKGQTGKIVNANWHDYKIPTALDVPADITSLPIDPGDTECTTTGAKGLGEPVTIPTAAAIANAVYHATGVRVTETPINPTELAALLAERGGGKGRASRPLGGNEGGGH